MGINNLHFLKNMVGGTGDIEDNGLTAHWDFDTIMVSAYITGYNKIEIEAYVADVYPEDVTVIARTTVKSLDEVVASVENFFQLYGPREDDTEITIKSASKAVEGCSHHVQVRKNADGACFISTGTAEIGEKVTSWSSIRIDIDALDMLADAIKKLTKNS